MIPELERKLDESLHGQHLVKDILLPSLRSRLRNRNPEKALVFSLQGPPGTGKNYVSEMVSDMFVLNGLHRDFIHLVLAPKEFPYNNRLDEYKVCF